MNFLKIFAIVIFVIFSSVVSSEIFDNDIKIVGGSNARQGAAPYIVSLQIKSISGGNDNSHFCGGAILDEHWILTAGHCLNGNNIHDIVIKAGRFNLEKKEESEQIRTVNYYRIHELYKFGAKPYDIALIYTKESFIWTEFVKSISLPEKDLIPIGCAELFGWGWLSSDPIIRRSAVLQTAEMPIISLSECAERMIRKPHETNICTGASISGKEEGITSCRGDSGGPLVQENVLIGITSWSRSRCGQFDKGSVFVRVSAFIDWIQESKKKFLKSV